MNSSPSATYIGLGLIALIVIGAGYYFSRNTATVPVANTTSATVVTAKTIDIEKPSSIPAPDPSAPQPLILTDKQKQALAKFGIAPESIPSKITASQTSCFESALGAVRVAEIRSGAIPSTMEFLKAKSCL